MSPLADAVLPLIRTRADVHRWSAADEHGAQMHRAVDLLEAAVPVTDPADVYAVVHAQHWARPDDRLPPAPRRDPRCARR